jgi:2,4-dienoyl-CoA reductase-like NADH-dependent reductase (Old Yellow Enzyme family)
LLAWEAGFDGVDIKGCHRYLNSELFSAFDRPGRYGGSFGNRTRFMRETVDKVREALRGEMVLASRLNLYNGLPADSAVPVRTDWASTFQNRSRCADNCMIKACA